LDPDPSAHLALLAPLGALPIGRLGFLGLALGTLGLSGFFSLLRSALLSSVPGRVLERARDDAHRARLWPLLERAEALATSASIFAIACEVAFVVVMLAWIGGESTGWTALGLTLAASVPLLVFAGELFPGTLRGERSDALLCRVLPSFAALQAPLGSLIVGLEATQRATMRLLRIPEPPRGLRRIVEDLRGVIEGSELEGELAATERELIENVFEFHDVDVVQVMTPRTEIRALEVESSLDECLRLMSETGHTRIPVYRGNIDTVIGLVYARELLGLVAEKRLEGCLLSELVRPIRFVPETKRVTELLTEFRREKQKTAVVLDEYGGTAGLVTLGDLVEEIVGDIRSETGEPEPAGVRILDDGVAEVDASTHITEVNEELGLELPEEADFETLAGYVLSQFGRFPSAGEAFSRGDAEFTVLEASDRRVLKVRVRVLQPGAR